jgi:hypothetical protein
MSSIDGIPRDVHVKPQLYAVACLDILGQRAEFANVPRFLGGGAAPVEVQRALERTHGMLRYVRGFFDHQYAAWNISMAGRAGAEALGGPFDPIPVVTYSFADTVVAFSLLSAEPASSIAVTGIVVTSGMLLAGLLAKGIPLRGGIEVGWASTVGEREVYGPALNEAHRLESEVAAFPRVVVGEGLLRYLQSAVAQRTASGISARAGKCAAECMLFIDRNQDGNAIVDHLGSVTEALAVDAPGYVEIARQAAAFVESQQIRFANDNDGKLAPRYTRALRYCNSRSAVWQGDADPATAQERYRQKRVEEQRGVYHETGEFLMSRGVHPREMSYDWATGRVCVGVDGSVDPSVGSALRAHLRKLGLVVSTIAFETKQSRT